MRAGVGKDDLLRKQMQTLMGNNHRMSKSIDEAVEVADRARKYILGLAWAKAVGMRPSKAEIAKVMSAIQGIKYPEKILQRTLDGKISRAEAQAFKAVYPNEYENLKKVVVEKIMALEADGEVLPFATRIRMSYVFGIKADRKMSLRYMTEMAQMRNASAQQQGQGQNPQSAKRETAAPELHTMFEETSETIAARTMEK